MDIVNLRRGGGKTTYCITRSSITDCPILCGSKVQKDLLIDKAKAMGVKIPEPITVNEFKSDRVKPNKVIVDEVFYVLGQMLEDTSIDTVTFSTEE